ncbi:MAG: (d)CMP kinase [Proteobacteria bacterium]|nr:(d)CMP kinase [Pseudomonadota bacterium]
MRTDSADSAARQPVIAIDGPAGAGKSTVAMSLAARLGFTLLDTGALYRAVALAAREAGLSWDDAEGVGALAAKLDLGFSAGSGAEAPRIMLGGRDRSRDIRSPGISRGASDVSRHPSVRRALLRVQQSLGELGGLVAEGRDTGTVVFPRAEVKVFLTADVATRAHRRQRELESKGIEADPAHTRAEIETRDRQDSTRPIAPLVPADDAIVVDTTGRTVEEVVTELEALVAAKTLLRP